jgi:Holliday junction resolvasome RuvABC endonuclease subunit
MILGIDVPGITKTGEGRGAWAVYDGSNLSVVDYGEIIFPPNRPERVYYKLLRQTLDRVTRKYHVHLIAIEHPFLYKIAVYVGAIKMWIASRRGLRWYMIGSSSARKTGLGSGKLEKEQVLRRISRKYRLRNLTQHQADAILYAVAASIKTGTV